MRCVTNSTSMFKLKMEVCSLQLNGEVRIAPLFKTEPSSAFTPTCSLQVPPCLQWHPGQSLWATRLGSFAPRLWPPARPARLRSQRKSASKLGSLRGSCAWCLCCAGEERPAIRADCTLKWWCDEEANGRAWFLSGRLLLGCCLAPFFVDCFKDAHHVCPRCHRVLHIHRKTCC